jgi:hypothetical protein
MSMLNIEHKENSPEKLAAIVGKDTKYFLMAEEFNDVVGAINNLSGKEDKFNKTQDIEAKKTSTTAYGSVKAWYDWLTDKLFGKVDKVAGERLINAGEITKLSNQSGTNTGDQNLSDLVVKNVAVTGATNTKITYDSKGLVTGGTSLTPSDIPPLNQNTTGTASTITGNIAESQVTGLVTDLSNKQSTSQKNTANGYAGLGSDGKLISSQLPSITITDTYVVGSQAAMLALVADTGDVSVRTDLNKSFILKGANPTVLGNWQELLTPTSSVTTVFGRNGAVTANAGDYTADQITETATRKFQTANQNTYNDATSSIQGQFNGKQPTIGYVTENVANKSDSYNVSSSITYSSTKALVDGLSTKQNTLTNPVTGTGTNGTLAKFTGSSTVGNSLVSENGAIVTTNGFVKTPTSTGGIINGDNAEKVLTMPTWTTSANINRDIIIGNFQIAGRIQIVLTGSFGVGDAGGCIIKEFVVEANTNNVIFTNKGNVTYANGGIVTQYAIGDFYWDATNSVYAIRISKLITATNSNLRAKVLIQAISGVNTTIAAVSVSSEYTLAALTRNFVNLPNNTGVGTAAAQSATSYIPIVPVSNLHTAENTSFTNAAAGHTIEQGGSGDAVTQYLLSGGQRWVAGIDNSDGDKYKIGSGELGSADKVIIDPTSGDVGITARITSGTTVLNNLPPTANNHVVRKDYLESRLPTTYTQVVYVNNVNPNSATIFDLNNPPTVNNNALKTDVNNLYIGSDASAWVYNGSIYVTKTDTAVTSNFFITGTNIDLGNSKSANASRTGTITAPAFIKTGGTAAQFLKADGSSDSTISSGTYTPTLTNTSNITFATLGFASYIRVGSIVTVTINLSGDVTTASSTTVISCSLPINRVSTTGYLVGSGIAINGNTPGHSMLCQLETNTTEVRFSSTPTISGFSYFVGTFSYKVD